MVMTTPAWRRRLFADPFINGRKWTKSMAQPFPVSIPELRCFGLPNPTPNVNLEPRICPSPVSRRFITEMFLRIRQATRCSIQREIAKEYGAQCRLSRQRKSHHQLVLISANPGDAAACLALNRRAGAAGHSHVWSFRRRRYLHPSQRTTSPGHARPVQLAV